MTLEQMMGGCCFVLELAPLDLKLEINQVSESHVARAAGYLAFVVAKAHASQMDHVTRLEWRELLDADCRTYINVPLLVVGERHRVGRAA